ncbi:MAG: peptidase C14, partial [Microcystaceae cyanobacterium]
MQTEATTETNPLLLQITDRAGLQAKALCLTREAHLEPGQLLQEALRFIPSSIGLTLALDSSLERIERVDATSALEEIEVVTQVVSQEEAADCVLGKLATGAYGLFAAGGQPLWETQLTSGQAIKSVIGQLQSVLERQLALKLLQLLENEQSSRLNLKVSLEARQSPNNLPLLQKTTRRPRFPQTQGNPASLAPGGDLPLTLSLGTQLQYRLENLGDRPLYCLILGQDSNGKSLAFLPEQEAVPFSPQQTLLIPPTDSAIAWQLSSGGILSEIQVIASQQPFTQTRQVLQSQLAAQ